MRVVAARASAHVRCAGVVRPETPPALLALHPRGSSPDTGSQPSAQPTRARKALSLPGPCHLRSARMPTKLIVLLLAASVGVLVLPQPVRAQSPTGLWDAKVVVNGVEVPFRFEIAGSGPRTTGTFFNGDDRIPSTTGTFENGVLTLNYDEYGTKLEATLKDGQLEGQYSRGTRGGPLAFEAKRFTPAPAVDGTPAIAGLWNVQVKSSKGESAWQLIVRQSGAEVSAAILRVDGDTGTLTGSYRDGKFVLSHFSGVRPLRVELTPAADGTMALVQNHDTPLTAIRAEQALARGLPQPSDPSRFTSVKDPTEPLRFSFPAL